MVPHTDEYYMKLALREAQKAFDKAEAPIGALIVRDGTVIARAHNLRETKKNALGHAELLAIDKACKKLGGWRLVGCTLYVTLEPCPMCSGAIINSRLPRVVFGARDPKAGCCDSVANLFEMPFNHRPEIVGGVLEQQCSEILTRFFKTLRKTKEK